MIRKAALASPHTSPLTVYPRSFDNAVSPDASVDALSATSNSDSPELRAIRD